MTGTAFLTGRRTKYVVLVLWLGLLVLASAFAGKLGDVERNDVKSSLPGSAESTRVLEAQSSFTPPGRVEAVVVYERAAGLTEADRAKVAADARAFGQRDDLEGTVEAPVIAANGKAAQILVPLDLGDDSFAKAGGAVATLRATAERDADGLAVYVTGPAGALADQSDAVGDLDTRLLLATSIVVVAILLLTYRSPILWLLPLLSVGVALTVAQALIYLLAKEVNLTVTADGSAILTILVLGVGTDYGLLLISRYREELRRHEDRHDAMGLALPRSLPAIVASAATVVAGMLCLLFADSNSTRALGPVFAIGVAVTMVVMLTLFPAVLVAVGRWIFWPARPRYGTAGRDGTRFWGRIGHSIARRPRVTWIVTAAALAALAVGVTQLNSNGLSNREAFRGTHDSVTGEEVLSRHFAAGAGSPIVVVSNVQQADQVRGALASTQGVDSATVGDPVVKGDLAYLEGTLTDPADSNAAFQTVERVRDRVHAISGGRADVGGPTAISLDVQQTAKNDRELIVPIVLLVVFLILVLLLRAFVAALILVATVVLSFAAALGASALIFRQVFGFDSEDSSFPLFVFVFIIALGIDYNIFLMTRVREEAAAHGTRPATLIGLAATGGVITSAGLVLAGTFAVLATLPLTQIAELGTAVALGVLLDSIVVRSVLVTALNLDIGRLIWWPSPLRHKADEPSTLTGAREAAAVDAGRTGRSDPSKVER